MKSSDRGVTDVYLDDVFVDNRGVNLSDPLASGNPIGWKEKLEAEQEKYAHLLKKPATWEQAEKQAEELMQAMLPVERFSFVCSDFPLGLQAFARLGIPNIHFADASCGVVNRLTTIVGLRHPMTVAHPCTLLLAATWNLELAKKYGTALGEECKSGPTHFLLGPGINLQRASWCGRNFEYMGEDPLLAGDMVAEYVRGLQSAGVCATLKHFIGNEIEFHRRGSNSQIDDRTLRELYMEPFRKGIEAGAFSVMTSYNLINGEWTGQSKFVNTELLRGELGFRGLIMTDWISTWDGEKVALSGMDLETPSGLALKRSKDKLVGSAKIDRMAKSVLATCIYAGLYENPRKDAALDKKRPEWETTALEVNREGIVLLKNNGMLPLAEKQGGRKILVLGNYAPVKELSGGGAAHVTGYNLRNYFAALLELFPDAQLTKYPTPQSPTPDEATLRAADTILIFSGFESEGEGKDTSFVLPDDGLIAKCVALNPRTMVSIISGCSVRMDWADQAGAIAYVFFGGQTGPEAFGDILTGQVNPSGRLPFTIEKQVEDSPAAALLNPQPDTTHSYPLEYIPQVFHGEFFPSADGKGLHAVRVDYNEGVFIGHRWYESKKIPVRFPFGHGLSYTTFVFEDLKIQKADAGKVRVSLNIKNTGARDGAEVVQLYVSDKECSVPRPPQELKAFQKVKLQPGESKQVEFLLNDEAFRFWSPATRKWTVEPGKFEIRAGASSADIRLQGTFTK
jgi:beta-glucosidase